VRPVPRWKILYEQLNDRRVIRTGLVYLAFFWGAVEVADLLAGAEMLSEDLVRWLLIGGLVGFPMVLVLSWFYDTPWRKRRGLSILGDVGIIVAISIAALLLAREQFFSSFTRPVVAIVRIQPTDIHPETAELANHLSGRFRMLLATRPEIRVIELASSQASVLTDLPTAVKASALGADLLIGGTVNQNKGEVRLNIQLFAADGELLWSEQFNDRLLDQAQLQNRVFNEIWPHLPLSGQALKDVSELVMSCEYPASTDAIRAIASSEAPDDGEAGTRGDIPGTLIDQNQDNGLLRLARARTYFSALETAPPTRQPILQDLAMRDLDQAELLCPGYPEMEALRLYHTHQIQGHEELHAPLLSQFPNESLLRLQMAAVYKESGDIEMATHLIAEAWRLNPADAETVCFYWRLLQSKGQAREAGLLQALEKRSKALSFELESVCSNPASYQ
jgi:TolB-like protein